MTSAGSRRAYVAFMSTVGAFATLTAAAIYFFAIPGGNADAGSPAASTSPAASPTGASPATDSVEAKINSLMAGMSVQEKVGQLFVVPIYGQTATTTNSTDVSHNRALLGVSNGSQLVKTYHVGGVILFTWAGNMHSPTQIAGLTTGMQSAAKGGIPLFIGTDQETGLVARLPAPATQLPGSMALGADGSATDAKTAAQITAKELRAVGINVDYAPDADVNLNPHNPIIGIRSFGANPTKVSGLVGAQVSAYQGAGEIAVAKHFPGHGDTNVDSHTGVPWIHHSLAMWTSSDAPPFKAAIAAGVDMVMVGHLVVPALEPKCVPSTGANCDPATLSYPIVTGQLRGALGYKGVVITDDLTMKGVRDKYGDSRIPVLAIKAGDDLLLDPVNLPKAYNAVLAAVRSGEIPTSRLDASVRRILRLKITRGLLTAAKTNPSLIGTSTNLSLARAITDRTTTLVKNRAGVLPVKGSPSILVTGALTADLASYLGGSGRLVTRIPAGTAPSAATIARVVAAARNVDVVVVTTQNVSSSTSAQASLVKQVVATGTPVVVAAIGTPYDLWAYPTVSTYLATYASNTVAMRSLARVIVGTVNPRGRLPVSIPSLSGGTLFSLGTGLSYP